MKRFLLKLFCFFVLVFILDVICGSLFRDLRKSAIGGDTARNEYIANKVTAPMLIFGSSRAIHHYNPRIFKDSLGIDCYNCGQDGMGIITFYGRYKLITQRYIPQLIIYDILTGFDIAEDENYSYLTWLKPYYQYEGIDSIFWKIEANERYKMFSQMYRYNGKILQMLIDNVANIRIDYNGYRPGKGFMDYEIKKREDKMTPNVEVDSIKMYFWEKFIQECKQNGTQLLFTFSPFYGGDEYFIQSNAAILKIAQTHNIPIISHLNDKDIIHRKDLFSDSFHMNHTGADIFSKKLTREIRDICESSY